MTEPETIIRELLVAYWMEMETVQNYIANANNLDGLRAEEVKKSLAEDVGEELSHAQQIAARVRVLGGSVPGSMDFNAEQGYLQPPNDSTDILSVIKGVIKAEEEAITQYNKIIQLCDGIDYPTQDLCISVLADEQEHKRAFEGFLKEFED